MINITPTYQIKFDTGNIYSAQEKIITLRPAHSRLAGTTTIMKHFRFSCRSGRPHLTQQTSKTRTQETD